MIVCVLPADGVPVGIPTVNVVLLAVTALTAILSVSVAPHGTSAVINIYPVAPLAMVLAVNEGKVLDPATPGVVNVDSNVAVPALNVLLV